MDVTPVIPAGRQLIKGYGDGGFTVAGERREGSLLVFPDRSVAWPVSVLEQVSLEVLGPVLDARDGVELLLLGCGKSMGVIPKSLKAALRDAGIRVEAMDTGAACRTFNVLLSEDRRVAAALIAV